MRRSIYFFFFLITLAAIIPARGRCDRVLETYQVPSSISGLAWDGERLWWGGYGERRGWIWGYDLRDRRIVDSIRVPQSDCTGLGWTPYGWALTTVHSDTTYFITLNRRAIPIVQPYSYMAGWEWDGQYLWGTTYLDPPGILVAMTREGEVVQNLLHTVRQGRDLAYLRGFFYLCDPNQKVVRVLNSSTGRQVRTIGYLNARPYGVASDGTHLYILDDGGGKDGYRISRIQVNEEGGIRLSAIAFNYGSVVVDSDSTWTLWVYNDGGIPARLQSLQWAEGNNNIFIAQVWEFPQTILPGDSAALPITFAPAYPDSARIRYGLTYDLDRTTYWVDLRGKGVPNIRRAVFPLRELNFGSIYTGEFVHSSALRYLPVENGGGEPLTIQEILFSDETFSYGQNQFPLTFNRPGLYSIPIFFRPQRGGQYRASATVFTNDPQNSRVIITLTAQAQLRNYPGGTPLWNYEVGNRQNPVPVVRAIVDIPDITGDDLGDLIIADNAYQIRAFHAASTQSATPVWVFRTDDNPWRSGLVTNRFALNYGDDWNRDGVVDIICGLDGRARTVKAISGRTGTLLWTFDTHHLRGDGGSIIAVFCPDDYTRDGIKDVVAGVGENAQGGGSNAVLLIDGSSHRAIWVTYLEFPLQLLISIGDVTGDRLTDYVAVGSQGDLLGLDGRRGAILWEAVYRGEVVEAQRVGDVNRDGSNDFYVVTSASGIGMFNGSNGVKLWEISGNQLDNLSASVPIGDINGNNSPDFILGDRWGFLRAVDGRTGMAAWDTSLNVGSAVLSLDALDDFNMDNRRDFVAGLEAGRVFAISSNGRDGIWSYSNVHEGHGFEMVRGTRDLDGNGQMDVVGAMQNGTVYCFAGSFIGLSVPNDPEESKAPYSLFLESPYPNPFNSALTLPFYLTKPGTVEVKIWQVDGRLIGEQSLGNLNIGRHIWNWNSNTTGFPLPSGMYIVEIHTGSVKRAKQVQLIR